MFTRWLVVLLLAAFALPNLPPAAAQAPKTVTGSQALQAPFIENVGQFPPQVRYLAYLESSLLYVTEEGLWLSVLAPPEEELDLQSPLLSQTPSVPAAGAWVKVSFSGASTPVRIESADPEDTPYSYFLGSQQEDWRAAVPVWKELRLVDLYPGLTLKLTAPHGQLRLQAQAENPAVLDSLNMQIEGVQSVVLEPDQGNSPRFLLLETHAGTVHFPLVEAANLDASPPGITAEITGYEVSTPYTRLAPEEHPITEAVKKWYQYSTFLGGSAYERSMDIAANRWGAAYVMGWTFSPDFPITPGAFDPSLNGGEDMYIVRIDPAGERLLYATFLGGSGDDYGMSLVIDAQGSVYVTGYTTSQNFPLTPGAFDPVKLGYYDGFVTRLDPSGKSLLFSTYLGGSEGEHANALAVDPQGLVYVTGMTTSPDFPLTAGALDTTVADYEAFLTIFQPDGRELVYSTLLGGQLWDEGWGVYAAGLDRVYVAGTTDSKDFPHTPYAFDRKMRWHEGFVVHYDLTRPKLVYATLLGGHDFDIAYAVAADKQGYVYVTGSTSSRNFPTTTSAYDTSLDGVLDTFITKLAPDGRSAVYSTFLGGSAADEPSALAVDRNGAVYLSIRTTSVDFPVTEGAFDVSLGGEQDAAVVKFAPDGSHIRYSTFLGGYAVEMPGGISLSANGSVFITGMTISPDFPVTAGVLDPWYDGSRWDGFVTRLWVQDQPPQDPDLMTPGELYLEEGEEPTYPYYLYLPVLPW